MKLVQLGSVFPLTVALAGCGGAAASPPPRSADLAAPAAVEPFPASSPLPPSPSTPATSPEAAAADRFFRAPRPSREWFAESFLRQAPIEAVQQILDQVREQLGAYHGVTGSGGDLLASFEHGDVPTAVHLDEQGRFTGLFLRPPVHLR